MINISIFLYILGHGREVPLWWPPLWGLSIWLSPYFQACKSHDQIMPWPDYLKTKGNVNTTFWDLCEILIVYILLSTFQSVHMVLTVNKPDVRLFIARIESADWNPWFYTSTQSDWPPSFCRKNQFVSITFNSREILGPKVGLFPQNILFNRF